MQKHTNARASVIKEAKGQLHIISTNWAKGPHTVLMNDYTLNGQIKFPKNNNFVVMKVAGSILNLSPNELFTLAEHRLKY